MAYIGELMLRVASLFDYKTDQSCNVHRSATQRNSSRVLIWPAQQVLNRLENVIAAINVE